MLIHTEHRHSSVSPNPRTKLALAAVVFVRHSQLLATLGTTCGQNATTIGSSHSLTETVFVLSFSVRRLECSFHCYVLFMLLFNPCRFGLQK